MWGLTSLKYAGQAGRLGVQEEADTAGSSLKAVYRLTSLSSVEDLCLFS